MMGSLVGTDFFSATSGDDILGSWTDANKEIVIKCYKKNEKYYAKIVSVVSRSRPGQPLLPEEQFWINLEVMKDFKYNGKSWVNGTIYNVKTDKTYSAFITKKNENSIRLTGYVFLTIFSESTDFYRVK